MNDPVNVLCLRLTSVKKMGDFFQAKCPAHDDKTASLSIGYGENGRAVLKCHAGCETKDILSALNLSWNDLFRDEKEQKVKARIDKVYNDVDMNELYCSRRLDTPPKTSGKDVPTEKGVGFGI